MQLAAGSTETGARAAREDGEAAFFTRSVER